MSNKTPRHGKLGAAAGCVIGHHEANKKDPNDANAQAPGQEVRPAALWRC